MYIPPSVVLSESAFGLWQGLIIATVRVLVALYIILIPTLLYVYLYFLSDTCFYLFQRLSKAPVLLKHCKASLAYMASAGEI